MWRNVGNIGDAPVHCGFCVHVLPLYNSEMTAIEFFLQKAQCFSQELEKLYWFLGIRNTAFW